MMHSDNGNDHGSSLPPRHNVLLWQAILQKICANVIREEQEAAAERLMRQTLERVRLQSGGGSPDGGLMPGAENGEDC